MKNKKLKVLCSFSKVTNQRGSMLIAAYLVITVLVGLGAVFMLRAHNEMAVAQAQRVTTSALHIAEAGLERAIRDFVDDFQDKKGGDAWIDGEIGEHAVILDSEDFDSYVSLPYDEEDSSNAFNNGTYDVRVRYISNDQIAIESTGRIDGTTVAQTIEATLKIYNLTVWDNAIFVGDSYIDGQIRAHGSIFILGDLLEDGDVALHMRGSLGKVMNNYDTIIQRLKALVPDLPIVNHNGQDVQSLSTTVRVKKGKIEMNGQGQIGKPDQDQVGDDEKETVDGVYVTDGFIGNNAELDGGIYTDEIAEYDLGDKMSMPRLTPDFVSDFKTASDTYTHPSSMLITPNTVFDVGNGPDGGCDGAESCISSDGNGNIFVKGKVYIEGGFSTDKVGGNKDLTYTGKGTVFARDDIEITTHLKTPEGDAPSFPDNVMGFMTEGSIKFTRPNIDVMGAFYAGTSIDIERQTQIIGTLVSNFVGEQSSNMSMVYQVPELADNLPPGMVGTEETTVAVYVTGWQKKNTPSN